MKLKKEKKIEKNRIYINYEVNCSSALIRKLIGRRKSTLLTNTEALSFKHQKRRYSQPYLRISCKTFYYIIYAIINMYVVKI